uniref:melanoma-associated antigen 10-like n=1 Tax=Jaculus jaculus TaxID=51337 RepID=UPI000332EB4C|nr:melanoma-associated antigen 10-like [Jaculus jaculus]
MSGPQNYTPLHAEADLHSQNRIQGAIGGQEFIQDDDTTSASAFSSSSYSSSFALSSASSVSPSVSVERIGATGTSNVIPPSGGFSSSSMISRPYNQSVQGEMQTINSQAPPVVAPCICIQIDVKVNELVHFLLHKYRIRELITKEEMLHKVIRNFPEYYPLIFYTASQYLLITFGTEVKEVDSNDNSYCLVPALGLTYDGMLSDMQGIPKTGLLILVLRIIYKQGHRASHEVVQNMLISIGLFGDSYHLLYPNAWKLITEDFVQEGYLVYRHVPHSFPDQFEFLWGPRAHAEINPLTFMILSMYITKAIKRFYPCNHLRLWALI